MTDDQYNLLKKFPVDKSYLTHKQLDEITKGKLDYDSLITICGDLHYTDLVNGSIQTSGLRITDKGLKALSHYEATTKRDNEILELNFKKLKYDVKISERMYNTYPYTQFIAWVSFIVALLLGFLKVAESLKLWPYHK